MWHDRAALHFLTEAQDRADCAERVQKAVRPGGHVILKTFARTLRSCARRRQVLRALAIAACTAFALSLFHELDASTMILMWNLGVAALIAGLATLFGRSVFAWTALRLSPIPNAGLDRR